MEKAVPAWRLVSYARRSSGYCPWRNKRRNWNTWTGRPGRTYWNKGAGTAWRKRNGTARTPFL